MKQPTKLTPKSREGRSREQRLAALIGLSKRGANKPKAA